MIIYIANGTVLHDVKYGWSEVLEINGDRAPHTFPQVLPNPADIKAYKEDDVIEKYTRVRPPPGGVEFVTVEEYDRKRSEYRVDDVYDEDSADENDIILAKARVKWLEFSTGLSPVYKKVRTEITPEIIRFANVETGSPYISCIPAFIGASVDFKGGKYFCFHPILGQMLAEAATRAGLDAAKTEIGRGETDLKYAKYGGNYLFLFDDHKYYNYGADYITLEDARERQKSLEEKLDGALSRWKAEHNKTNLPAGEVIREVEHWKSLLLGIRPNSKADVTTRRVLLNSIDDKIKDWGGRVGGKG